MTTNAASKPKASTNDKVPPHNLDAEASLLGAAMLDGDAVEILVARTCLEDFYKPGHQHIAAAIRSMAAQHTAIDAVTLADELRRGGLLETIGGQKYLNELVNATPALSNASSYARIVATTATARRLIAAGDDLAAIAYAASADTADMLNRAQEVIDRIARVSNIAPTIALHDVTVADFAAVIEPGANPIAGTAGEVVVPVGGDVMIYGDGGAGKTTMAIDFAFHLGSASDWLGLAIPVARNVMMVENEGPRPPLRDKVARKLAAWTGPELDDRVRLIDEPWAQLNLANQRHRDAFAALIAAREVDVAIIGPLATSGMIGAGTLHEVRDFLAFCADVRHRSNRPVTFIVIHHENRGGKVSGAWEGAGDTLIHVTGKGNGHVRLYFQKVRWSSTWHAQTLDLRWADGEAFEIEDKPEISDDDLADAIIAFVAANAATSWTPVEKAVKGVSGERRRDIRDRLLTDDVLVNIITDNGVELAANHVPQRKPARLHLASDPTIAHLRLGSDAAQTQAALDLG